MFEFSKRFFMKKEIIKKKEVVKVIENIELDLDRIKDNEGQ